MNEHGYTDAYLGSAGEQEYSWLGITVKFEYLANKEKAELDNYPHDDRDMEPVWDELDKSNE